ncbi:MAG: putative iron-sulfur cluster-binding metallochaperone [Candidatus Rokuibacteriota bacterium]
MSDCCRVGEPALEAPDRCPECGRVGRKLDRITLKALLRPDALARLSAPEHRFCPSASCRVVYFGLGEIFRREDVLVPIFQREPAGDRIVCYCFAVSEGDIRREVEASGRSTVVERITELVKADRCACEVRNPQGTCCLGNVTAVVKAAQVEAPVAL